MYSSANDRSNVVAPEACQVHLFGRFLEDGGSSIRLVIDITGMKIAQKAVLPNIHTTPLTT